MTDIALADTRTDRNQTPYLPDGTAVGGGPWMRFGEADAGRIGEFNYQNQTLALVASAEGDGPGKASLFVSGNTRVNHNEMVRLGLRHDAGVPIPQIDHYYGAGEEKLQKRTFLQMLGLQSAINNQGESKWQGVARVTGTHYAFMDQPHLRTWEPVTDSTKFGTYNTKDGLLTFIDLEGQQHISSDYDYLRDHMLTHYGYHRDESLPVPFTNGERTMSRAISEILRNVRSHDNQQRVASR